jgi:hypothetical protein
MKAEEYLDFMLDKDTDDIVFLDSITLTSLDIIDYESEVISVTYKKIAYITIGKK